MTIIIENSGPCLSIQSPLISYTIDFTQSVRNLMGKNENLTNETALKIFKQIKLKSDIISFLTRAIVFIPLTFVPFGLAAVTSFRMTLLPLSMFFSALGGSMLGLLAYAFIDNRLSKISKAYSDQSQQAADYIKKLETSKQEFVFRFES